MGAIYYKGKKYGAMPATAANLPYSAGSQDSTKDKIDANALGVSTNAAAIAAINAAFTPAAITNLSYNGVNVSALTYGCYKYGRLVVLNITGLTTARAIGSTENELITGLPIPIDESNRFVLFVPESNVDQCLRVRVTNDGRLICWYGITVPQGTSIYGNIIYLAAN